MIKHVFQRKVFFDYDDRIINRINLISAFLC